MKKILLRKILSITLMVFLIFSVFGLIKPEKSYAVSASLYDEFCNNNNRTVWEVATRMFYKESGVWSGWKYVDTNQAPYSTIVPPINLCAGYYNRGERSWGTHRIDSSVQWYTACVDPVADFSGYQIQGTGYYIDNVDVSCKTGTSDKYIGCGDQESDREGLGRVDSSIKCPANKSNKCVKAGWVWSCNGTPYCGTGGNRCTRFGAEDCDYPNSSRGDGRCKRDSTPNSSICIGTDGCCNSNNDCATGRTCVSQNAAGYGVCDDRYACDNDTGTCSLTRGGTWPIKSDCNNACTKNTKDLVVSVLTFPGGIRGSIINQNNLVLNIKNTGNTQITGDFTVRLCNGDGACKEHLVQQTVSANESIDLSGASEFNLPRGNPAGSYTANATVDYYGNIAEDDETNNSRTDVYTTTNPDCNIDTCGACNVACGAGTKTCTYTSYSGGGACNTGPAPSQPCNPTCSGQICVSNACITPTCNTGTVCGACSVACGAGTKSCVFTTYNDGPIACTQAGAPPQTCNQPCSGSTPNCVSNVCVCSAVGVPTGLAPSGNLNGDQTLNITWNAVAGASAYKLIVNDTNGTGDINTEITGTSYSYNFQSGHSYNITVQSKSDCGTYSSAASVSVTVLSYISGHIFIDNANNSLQDDTPGYPKDTNYAGTTVTKTGGATETRTTNGSGDYGSFWETPGTYTVSIAPGGNYAVAPSLSQSISVPPSGTVNFRLVPLSYIWGHVYIDNDNSNSENIGDTVYTGLSMNLSGGSSSRAPTPTDGSGNYGFWSLLPGGYTVSFTPPDGYTAPITQQSTIVPPDRVLSSYRLIPDGWFNPKGNHDAASCTVTTGWTCDPDNYTQAINVSLYKDGPIGTGTPMGTAIASGAREAAVAAQCGGNANHGFSFNIPASIYDGVAHPIYAYATNIGNGNANPLLSSSPKTITCARSIVNIHVYNDNNGNGAEDEGETGSSGKTVTATGGGLASSPTTDGAGNVQITNLLPGSLQATVTVPGGWSATTANPATANYPPSPAQINIGIQPPPPTCAGGLTASPTSVNPGGTSLLTCNNPISTTGDALSYTYFPDSYGDSVTNTNTATARWTAPNPYWTAVIARPAVKICDTGGNGTLCSSYTTNINIVPLYSISGNVFVDINKDGLKTAVNPTESNYIDGPITITSSNGSVPTYSNGAFTVANLPAGSYKITYSGLPTDYKVIYPGVIPPEFTVTVGGGCWGGGSNSATCTNFNISNLNFGIIYGSPWIQSGGSDMWFNGGFSEAIPSGATCQSYASITGPGGTPGIIYSNGTADFGKTGGQASTNPYNWKVNSIYTPVTPNSIRSSFSYINALVAQNHITPINLNTIICPDLSACNLGNLANGVYSVTGDVTLIGNGGSGKYNFPPNKDFVFLINGNLTINTEISVPKTSTALFTTLKDITVASNIGTNDKASTAPNLEGWFSAGANFNIRGTSTCPTPDLRLNVAGAIVVNAELKGGSFNNTERDLCAGNLSCPVFYIEERPDFTLNAPTFLQAAPRIWQEVAP